MKKLGGLSAAEGLMPVKTEVAVLNPLARPALTKC
jgi:hypothetical protein